MTEDPKRERQRKQTTSQLSGVQIMFAAILAIGMILAINFSTRLAGSRPLRDYYEDIEQEIEQLSTQQALLRAESAFYQSDAYVEQWARSEGKMVKPGEVLVVPIPFAQDQQATPVVPLFTEVETSPPEPDNWELWWSLLFDSPPPEL